MLLLLPKIVLELAREGVRLLGGLAERRDDVVGLLGLWREELKNHI